MEDILQYSQYKSICTSNNGFWSKPLEWVWETEPQEAVAARNNPNFFAHVDSVLALNLCFVATAFSSGKTVFILEMSITFFNENLRGQKLVVLTEIREMPRGERI